MINDIEAAARKALISADPAYYSWPAGKQEEFRATLSDDAKTKNRQVLLASLLKITCKLDQVDDVWSDLPLSRLHPLNWASLLTSGIGADYIYLNERMAKEKSLLDFPTLYDYDYDDYLFQEQANRQEFVEYAARDYYALRHASWAHLLIEREFYFANILSLATHIGNQLEEECNDFIQSLIPHKLVDGKNHGKRVAEGFTWDMKINAAGKEGELDELKSRWYSYQIARWTELSKAYDGMAPAVYTHKNISDSDPNCSFIFHNAATLRKIRWKHFLADCAPLTKSYDQVATWIAEEGNRAKSYLLDQYQDILRNYDPAVIKLKKKRKIIMTDRALADLEKISLDDESPSR